MQNQEPESLLNLPLLWSFSHSYCWACSHSGLLILEVETNWSVRFPVKINELGFSQKQQLFKSCFTIHSAGIFIWPRVTYLCRIFFLSPLIFQAFFSVSDLSLTILLCFPWCLRGLMVGHSSWTFRNFFCTLCRDSFSEGHRAVTIKSERPLWLNSL